MKAAVVSEIGYRFAMEDAHFLDTNFAGKGWVFGGVYDGHVGTFAALLSSKYLHKVFLDELSGGGTPEASFTLAYEETSRRLAFQESGTTAVTFLIKDGYIFTAHAGDARAIVIGTADVRQLTADHRVDNPDERKRILAMGGKIRGAYVYRGASGLMPTRTIGDEFFKPVGIIATPEVTRYAIADDDIFLIAACDGLFDVMRNDEVAVLARRFTEPDELLEALKTEVLFTRRGPDNLTMIAVSLRNGVTS